MSFSRNFRPLVALCCGLLLCGACSAWSQPEKPQPVYDAATEPRSESTLLQQVQAAANDPVRLYELTRASQGTESTKKVLSELAKIALQQPGNATARAAFCDLLNRRWDETAPSLGAENMKYQQYRNDFLRQAKTLAPNAWLTYVADASEIIRTPKESLILAQKAVRVAPEVAVAHEFLGHRYYVYALNSEGDRPALMQKAIQEYNVAIHLDPSFTTPWWGLMLIYAKEASHRAPRRAAACGREYLRRVHPKTLQNIMNDKSMQFLNQVIVTST